MDKATWTNGKRRVTGYWEYHRHSDRFLIILDSRDRLTGRQRRMEIATERPEWGNWKLVRDEPQTAKEGGK